MGLLSLGTPLSWDEAQKHADHVRSHGITQLLNIFHRLKTRKKDHLLWGDEVEYVVVNFDDAAQKVTLSLDAHATLEKLEKIEKAAEARGDVPPSSWKPEYGRYMLESTPGAPYGSSLKDLLSVEPSMRDRRALAISNLPTTNNSVLTITSFPLLGSGNFWSPPCDHNPLSSSNGAARSLFIPDVCINEHVRFPTLTKNIRTRRGGKVAINLPIFVDRSTPRPFREPIPDTIKAMTTEELRELASIACSTRAPEYQAYRESKSHLLDCVPDAKEDSVYLDCMCFGMGCCCLQITFQACSIEEARRLYDQLAVVSPIMLTLSAAAPIFKGYLTDVDCRWNVIAGAVDDRTREERGLDPLENSRFVIPKSRYDSVSHYLSNGPNYSGPGGCSTDDVRGNFYKEKYNDYDLVYDKSIHARLIEGGMDEPLARHFAHLFIRDPLVIYRELLDQDDEHSSDHFENIQSTNWQTMRFKPPPPQLPNMGWRVEFRSCEVQPTDYENAAFAVFVVLLTRTILSFDLNFYIPISKVDENMQVAQRRDAVLKERFWFRKNVFGSAAGRAAAMSGLPSFTGETNGVTTNGAVDEDAYDQFTINEIINGKGDFPGLVPLVESYLKASHLDHKIHSALSDYVSVISRRATGKLKTAARWTRDFVGSHPQYLGDSVVNQKVAYDLVRKLDEIGRKKGSVCIGMCPFE
ncbi:glutamate-cysteine ligase-domain-containing protein [Cladochytrium replicatum]|nr:glutamate-cysteine ligase-domain-containing protein [Cladochytrium replicatum]